MTVKSHLLPTSRAVSGRVGARALYAYYYGYFAAEAETV